MTEAGQKWRMMFCALLLVLAWCALAARLTYLHLGGSPGLEARIQKIRKVEEEMLVGRGRLLDRNGKVLALDIAVKHVNVDPKVAMEKKQDVFLSRQLGRVLQMDPAMVLSLINRSVARPRRQVYIKKYVRDDATRQISSMNLESAGVFFDNVSQRNYPHGQLLCHVLGYSSAEGHGASGLELRLDRFLRGVPGLRVSEKDGNSREVYDRRSLEIQPQEGADVYLTLDQNLQYFAESALDTVMEQWKAKSAWAAIQDVKTGRLLAMASRPSFDLNDYGAASDAERINRVIGYTYEPGSTFKVASIAAALEARVVKSTDVFDCENGRWSFGGKILRDTHPHGRLSVADVLKVSSNIGAGKIALMLGEDRLYASLRDFGFGRPLGIDLPGEDAGILPSVKTWAKIKIARIPMGQGVAVTSLQMLAMLSCIANDGALMRPLVIDRIVDKNGKIIAQPEPMALSHPISPETARLMRKMLVRVTEDGGTGKGARVDGYTVAGKTGTAQKVVDGRYSDTAYVGSFMGFLPAERPAIAIMVVVDEPSPLHTGGAVAAPAFREIAEKAVRYLDIPPVEESAMWRFGDEIPSRGT